MAGKRETHLPARIHCFIMDGGKNFGGIGRMNTYGIGIIGWGFMGRAHAHAVRALPLYYPGADFRARLACVATRSADAAARAKEDLGFSAATADYRELIARDDVHVVSVCTPNELHEEMALAVLKAGKHLYIDKPLAVTGESALHIAEAARTAKGFSKVAFNLRHYPATMRLKELADAGELGEILQFSARYLHAGSIDPDRPIGWKQQKQGGVLLDMGSHVLDMVTWLMGYPERVSCSLRTLYSRRPRRDGSVETELSDDHALMTLIMPGGAMGTVEASKIATGALDEMTIEIRGAKGAAIFTTMQPNYLRFFDQSRPERPLGGARGFTDIECAQRYPAPGGGFPSVKNAIGWDRAHVDCYFDFLHCISRGRRPESTVEKAARLQKLMDTLVKSAEAGEWARV